MEHILENGNNTWCDKTVHALCYIKFGFKDVQSIPPPHTHTKIIKPHKNKQANQTKLKKKNQGLWGCLKIHCRSVWEISFKIYVLFDNVNFYYFFFLQ